MASNHIQIGGAANSTAPLNITNSTNTAVAATASQITTGSPTTVGLIIQGTENIALTLPSGSTFYASLASSVNATYSDGSGTGTLGNSATISGGYLDLTGGTAKYASWAGASNFSSADTATIRFLITPNFSGNPANYMYPFFTGAVANGITLEWASTDGSITLYIYNSSGTNKLSHNFGVWNPTSGTEYEWEISWDTSGAGAARMFINGVQHGTTGTNNGSGSRTASAPATIYISNPATNSNFKIRKFLMVNQVLHTSNFAGELPHVYGITDQTSALQQWKNSAGTVLSSIDSSGNLSYTPTNTGDWNGTDPHNCHCSFR